MNLENELEIPQEVSGRERFKPLFKVHSETGMELNFKGKYIVGDKGTIIALPKKVKRNHMSGYVCIPRPTDTGHLQIAVSDLEYGKIFLYVHRLVASAWLKRKSHQTDVMHLDDNPSNNTIENLRWATHTDNMRDKVKKGRHGIKRKYTNDECIAVFKERESGKSIDDIQKMFPHILKSSIYHMTSGEYLRKRGLLKK